jgi:hypothetical protein
MLQPPSSPGGRGENYDSIPNDDDCSNENHPNHAKSHGFDNAETFTVRSNLEKTWIQNNETTSCKGGPKLIAALKRGTPDTSVQQM